MVSETSPLLPIPKVSALKSIDNYVKEGSVPAEQFVSLDHLQKFSTMHGKRERLKKNR